MKNWYFCSLSLAFSLTTFITFSNDRSAAAAILADGIEFSQDNISFVDRIVQYAPGSGVGPDNRFAEYTLGVPDYRRRCPGCDYASLGNGGRLVAEFQDNRLTGSDDERADLWIFEIGPVFEAAFVSISPDGLTWFDLGKTEFPKHGFDLDAFGFGRDARFAFVRIVDELPGPGYSYPQAGADIDAIGAASTVKAPEPSSLLALIAIGIFGVGRRYRQR